MGKYENVKIKLFYRVFSCFLRNRVTSLIISTLRCNRSVTSVTSLIIRELR